MTVSIEQSHRIDTRPLDVPPRILLGPGPSNAHPRVLQALGMRQADFKFGHAALHDVEFFHLLDSYHCSRYNTNTRRLTAEMFDAIFAKARELLDNQRCE